MSLMREISVCCVLEVSQNTVRCLKLHSLQLVILCPDYFYFILLKCPCLFPSCAVLLDAGYSRLQHIWCSAHDLNQTPPVSFSVWPQCPSRGQGSASPVRLILCLSLSFPLMLSIILSRSLSHSLHHSLSFSHSLSIIFSLSVSLSFSNWVMEVNCRLSQKIPGSRGSSDHRHIFGYNEGQWCNRASGKTLNRAWLCWVERELSAQWRRLSQCCVCVLWSQRDCALLARCRTPSIRALMSALARCCGWTPDGVG